MAQVRLENWPPVRAKLYKSSQEVMPEVKEALDKGAQWIKDDMALLAPLGKDEDAGRLKRSMGTYVDNDDEDLYSVRIGPSDDLESGIPGMPYPVLVEYGVHQGKYGARPFARNAYDLNITVIDGHIRDAVKKTLGG